MKKNGCKRQIQEIREIIKEHQTQIPPEHSKILEDVFEEICVTLKKKGWEPIDTANFLFGCQPIYEPIAMALNDELDGRGYAMKGEQLAPLFNMAFGLSPGDIANILLVALNEANEQIAHDLFYIDGFGIKELKLVLSQSLNLSNRDIEDIINSITRTDWYFEKTIKPQLNKIMATLDDKRKLSEGGC